ncbi:FAD-linked oxidase C-terminal domain-containing protein [Sulfobacillus sp. hq2]|uniref:FAD-linked oxidase C-terminal domain-containing protein n=1 Tax=Sulfobacillus TaxID=28033 RepID=UPI000CD2A1BE|nr:FAD-linked oxidase C-terminal domain-containing protein [Sulfobacillus sp. hq2]POB10659.1 FAD-binding oxidoreductase [Sulfobacillus sp. hq2]
MLPEPVIHELEDIVGRNNLIVDEHRIVAYDCDAYVAEKYMPSAVVFPETTEQVVAIVRCLGREGIPFLPRGAGTGLSGGATPLNHEVVISLAKMDKLLDLDFENRRATVQPGFVNLRLTKEMANDGFYYAPDPSSQSVCTIGGNFAENSGGSHCLKYGVTTNHVVAAEVVLPSGEVITVGEPYGDSIGYDLLGVLVGSEGTLGITTAITVKILPKAQAVKTFLAYFDRVDDASQTVSDIIAQGIVPAACEMMDQLMIHAVDKSVYHVGYPDDIEAVLLVEIDGMLESVEDNAQRVLDVCNQNRVRTVRVAQNDRERALWWNSRKMAFPAIGRISPDYLVQDGVIPRTKLSAVLQRISALSAEYGLRVANVFHAGDGNLHPLICYDARIEGQLQQALALGQRILEVCVDMGGSITGEHGVGIEKIGHMAYMFSEHDLKAQQDLRDVFNPQGLCNSGKLVPRPGACVEDRSMHHVVPPILVAVGPDGGS